MARGQHNTTRERYQLALHAESLPNSRWCGKICPYATVKITSGPQMGTELGETETIDTDEDPDWVKLFYLEFAPGEVTNLEVNIWDYRLGSEEVHIGEVNFEATSVYRAPGKTISADIGKSGKVYCHIEKSIQGGATGTFKLHLRGLDMKNVEPGAFGLGRSDPFFEISKRDADYTAGHVKWNVIYRSKHINDNLNPYWKPLELPLEDLCYGKLDWPLKISVYDHNEKRKHKLIGEIFETSVVELEKSIAVKGNADREKAIPICREDKSDKKYGLICVLKAEQRP